MKNTRLSKYRNVTINNILIIDMNEKHPYYNCRCHCGKEFLARIERLKDGTTVSCGCPVDIVGKKFNNWTVKKYAFQKKRCFYWECQCICGKIKNVQNMDLIKQRSQSCGCTTRKNRKKHPQWKGYEEISHVFFNKIRRHAISREIPFNITIEYIWELFLEQERKCALTDRLLIFRPSWQGETTSSLDRINSDKRIGYIPGNVQWVHKDINIMKMDYNQEEIIQAANEIARKHPRPSN
jgi:hypothetical protein